MLKFIFCLLLVQPPAGPAEHGLFVSSLWLLQQFGSQSVTDSQNDLRLKSVLAKALAKDGVITLNEVSEFMSSESFQKIAGKDDAIDVGDVARTLGTSIPESRTKLNAQLRSHVEYLTTTYDMIDDEHRNGAQRLANWMVSKYDSEKNLDVIVICTGNSRRSILGASMGNLAAAYYGLTNVQFYSGGTAPTAFNSRTIATLKAIGFSVEATGSEATRGEPKTSNPVYRVKWGHGMESIEFSKHYADKNNPQHDFAALLVCTEADAGCPSVTGALLRLSMPYFDPKSYDDSPLESVKYAERRDDIGRTMLSALCQVRRLIDAKQRQPASQ